LIPILLSVGRLWVCCRFAAETNDECAVHAFAGVRRSCGADVVYFLRVVCLHPTRLRDFEEDSDIDEIEQDVRRPAVRRDSRSASRRVKASREDDCQDENKGANRQLGSTVNARTPSADADEDFEQLELKATVRVTSARRVASKSSSSNTAAEASGNKSFVPRDIKSKAKRAAPDGAPQNNIPPSSRHSRDLHNEGEGEGSESLPGTTVRSTVLKNTRNSLRPPVALVLYMVEPRVEYTNDLSCPRRRPWQVTAGSHPHRQAGVKTGGHRALSSDVDVVYPRHTAASSGSVSSTYHRSRCAVGRLSMLTAVQIMNYRFFLHAQYTARSLAKPGYRCLNSSDMCK
jgi:hypothetical protein